MLLLVGIDGGMICIEIGVFGALTSEECTLELMSIEHSDACRSRNNKASIILIE